MLRQIVHVLLCARLPREIDGTRSDYYQLHIHKNGNGLLLLPLFRKLVQ